MDELKHALLGEREQEQVTAIEAVEEASGPEAGHLIAGLMLRNAHELEGLTMSLYESEKADHQRTKDALADANVLIDKMHRRLGWLCGYDELLPEDLESKRWA